MTANDEQGNPLREGRAGQRIAPPCTMVIFGASGDLTRRKLLPALYSLARDRMLPVPFNVIGVARTELDDQGFRSAMRDACNEFARRRPIDEALWESFAAGIFYVTGTFEEKETFARLKERIETIERERGTFGNRVFYLATPPSECARIVKELGAAALVSRPAAKKPFSRVIVEKPFGHDLASARALNRELHEVLDEEQTYRIDHYLGKETVQNILVFRFGNGIWEPLWNNRYIDHVQLTVAESIGVAGRGGYFEQAGILRDIVQNHMLQFLCLMAMEPPVAFEAEAVRDEKLKVLRSLRPMPEGPAAPTGLVVRGQYGSGFVGGEPLIAYREEPSVAPDSTVETFVALKAFIDNWRWAGVPFYLRAGKALPRRATEIAIHFKRAPHLLFAQLGEKWLEQEANVLALRLQPDEGIALNFLSKVPGPALAALPVAMEFRYNTSFGAEPPEAYERLILDCLVGDNTLFIRADEAEAAWSFIDPIERGFATDAPPRFPNYEAGSWGPEAADQLIAADGRAWRRP